MKDLKAVIPHNHISFIKLEGPEEFVTSLYLLFDQCAFPSHRPNQRIQHLKRDSILKCLKNFNRHKSLKAEAESKILKILRVNIGGGPFQKLAQATNNQL